MNRLREAVATFFYTGYAPVAPGTAAAALAAGICIAIFYTVPAPGRWFVFGGMVVLALAGNVFSARWARERFRSPDPSHMVVDEALGMFVSVFLLPANYFVLSVGAGFLLFRVFDIAKPFPIRRLERLPGWLGISLDDLAAGVYANLVIQAGYICYNALAG